MLTGTATEGGDFVSVAGSANFAPGEGFAYVTITPIDESEVEPKETVTLTLDPSTNNDYEVGLPDSVNVDILDNDTVVSVSASDTDAREAGVDPGTFVFSRSGYTADPLTVYYTLGGTAEAGSDYSGLLGSVTFAAGQTSAIATVTPINDSIVESTETIVLALASASIYTIASPSNATVNIADNDSTVTVTASDDRADEEGQATGTFTFTRSGYTANALTVNFTVAGTATPSNDYGAAFRERDLPGGAVHGDRHRHSCG